MTGASASVRGRLVARNAALNLVGEGLPLVVGLLSIPFALHGLGPARFGILSLAWVVVSYFSAFDLGLGRAATKFLAEAFGAGAAATLPAIAWTALLIQALLGAAGGLVLAGITPLLVGQVFQVPRDLAPEALASFRALALAVPLILISGSLRAVLEAAQRFDLVNLVKAPFGAATFLIPVVGVLAGWTLPGIIAALVASRGLALAVLYYLCVAVVPVLQGAPRFHRGHARALFGFGGWITISSVVGPLLIYLDRFVIGTVLSLAAVTHYTAPYEMVTRLLIIPASLVTALFPALSVLGARTDSQGLATFSAQAVKYLLVLTGPAAVLIAAFAHEILRGWVGPEVARAGSSALQILAPGVLVNALSQVPYSALQASGRPDLTAKFHLVELPLHALLTWGLVSTFGVPGAALAWTIRVSVDAALLFAAAGRLSLLSVRAFVQHRVFRVALLMAVLSAVGAAVATAVPATGYRAAIMVASLFGFVAVVWRHAFEPSDRTRLVGLLRLSST